MPDAPQLFRDLKRYETFDKSNEPGGWSAAEGERACPDEIA